MNYYREVALEIMMKYIHLKYAANEKECRMSVC